jgi:hypothetical protein
MKKRIFENGTPDKWKMHHTSIATKNPTLWDLWQNSTFKALLKNLT